MNLLLKKKIDVIINLSGQISDKKEMSKTILKGNKNIIRALNNNKKTLVYYISSTLVYGHSPVPLDEKSKTKAISYYSKIKLKGEKIFESSHINYKILRLSNVYSSEKKSFLNNLIYSLKYPKKLIVQNINSYRNYIHIDDVVEIIKKIIDKKLKYKIYNIGHENLKLKTIINTIEKKFKKKIDYIDKRKTLKFDSSQIIKKGRILNEINFYPKIKFKKFINSYKIL